ncbi:MAG: DUF4177 domain-containing protein [Deferribacteraceae bacterium]|jgi:hypothetical protein|nr:DUF4177 domain-containing protein [Deferribacteraceae bacterium]
MVKGGVQEREPAPRPQGPYVVLQMVLKKEFLGSGSANLTELEDTINAQAAKGYRLHTITTANFDGQYSKIQATMVFEKL